jgi:hypothetical protein
MLTAQQVSLKYKSEDGVVHWRNFVGRQVDRGESWEVYLRTDDGTIVFYDKSSLKIFDLAATDELVSYLDGPVVDRVKRELTYLEHEDAEAPLNKF